MASKDILCHVRNIATISTTQIESIFGNLGSWRLGLIICSGLYILYALHHRRSINVSLTSLSRRHDSLHFQVDVPALGVNPIILGTWIEAFRFVWDSAALIEDGVRKAHPPVLPLADPTLTGISTAPKGNPSKSLHPCDGL